MQNVTASEVRTWAVNKGLAKVGKGRLSLNVVSEFNSSHKSKVHTSGFKSESLVALSVPFVNKAGANRVRTVNIPAAELRALEGSEGKRGRIRKATKESYVASLTK